MSPYCSDSMRTQYLPTPTSLSVGCSRFRSATHNSRKNRTGAHYSPALNVVPIFDRNDNICLYPIIITVHVCGTTATCQKYDVVCVAGGGEDVVFARDTRPVRRVTLAGGGVEKRHDTSCGYRVDDRFDRTRRIRAGPTACARASLSRNVAADGARSVAAAVADDE